MEFMQMVLIEPCATRAKLVLFTSPVCCLDVIFVVN